MEYCNGILCISRNDLVNGGIMTSSNYDTLVARKRINVVRSGKGLGNYALIAVDSLPKIFLDKIDSVCISPFASWVKANYTLNQQALGFYMDPFLCGKKISCTVAISLAVNASLLDLLIKITSSPRISAILFGSKIDWETVCRFLATNRSRYGHTLPLSRFRLRDKLQSYQRSGLSSLISGKFGNQNARKE